ncbi:hypothetical protein B0J13DRAFT_546433 [Dactylonectria estremocensis]|uniref:Uncharacterized protein n=1 Tax=Dactylonectria estremocensis TaxID=1079267 RepID=A0A9P9JF60_9HYPO|nr:hypothetical protein B0J13DRAFT_546433 [Dactylonectria estremocensis]
MFCKLPTHRAPKRKTVTQWACCVCGHSGMSVNVPVCPYCQTPRCAYCVVERVRVKPAHVSRSELAALASQNNHSEDGLHRYDTDSHPFNDGIEPDARSGNDLIHSLANNEHPVAEWLPPWAGLLLCKRRRVRNPEGPKNPPLQRGIQV